MYMYSVIPQNRTELNPLYFYTERDGQAACTPVGCLRNHNNNNNNIIQQARGDGAF
jgi:hypothetical protein